MAGLNFSSLTRDQLESILKDSTKDDKESPSKKKGPTYNGLPMGDMMDQFNQVGAEELLKHYGRNADIKWGL